MLILVFGLAETTSIKLVTAIRIDDLLPNQEQRRCRLWRKAFNMKNPTEEKNCG
jgi:hypothetical protein